MGSTSETGGYVPKQKETVAQFMQRWLATYAATNTTPRTQVGYQGNVNRYITPAIGNIELQKLTARHIQGMYADMLERELSARTVLHTHRVLKEALSHGVKWGVLTRNVADATSPPRPEAKEMEMWDVDTIHRGHLLPGGEEAELLALDQLLARDHRPDTNQL